MAVHEPPQPGPIPGMFYSLTTPATPEAGGQQFAQGRREWEHRRLPAFGAGYRPGGANARLNGRQRRTGFIQARGMSDTSIAVPII